MSLIKGDRLVEERKEKAVKFVKDHPFVLALAGLIVIILLSTYIRSLPMAKDSSGKPGLWDLAANDWTLGPDLDPFLFLRWSQYIVEHGSLPAVDSARYVPLGFETKGELVLLSYSMAWFHEILATFHLTESVTYSAIIFPVFFFALTIVAFFFMTQAFFSDLLGKKRALVLALVASLFLTIIPALLPRTIAGIPEKESAGFFFIFLTFFLFTKAWKQERKIWAFALGAAAGISTILMSLVWGGVIYIFVTLALAAFLAFIFGKMDRKGAIVYAIWIVLCMAIMPFCSSRYSLEALINSTMMLIPLGVLGIIACNEIVFGTSLKKIIEPYTRKLPQPIVSIILTFFVGLLLATLFLGPSFVADKTKDLLSPMITPIHDRLGVTVAENRQPFFDEWASSFGPIYFGIPLFFWLFMIGSVALVYLALHHFGPWQKRTITASYVFFLVALVFSRYNTDSIFNGTNFMSIAFYGLGVIVLAGCVGKYYFENYKHGSLEKFKSIDFALLLLFSFFFFSIVSARGSVRTIMVLVPTAAIMASFLPLFLLQKCKSKEGSTKTWLIVVTAVVGLLLILAGINFYKSSTSLASQYVPSVYTFQWQGAMAWVRDHTPQTAVFAHWWDYGYWIQSIGQRSTVLDGGNSVAYWNHLMGRLVLTGTSPSNALQFLFTHKVTHLLIDSTDIGKYSAFASIGSDESYDRLSYIPTFALDPQAIQERKNSTLSMYRGTFALDEDIIYTENESKIFLPAGQAAVLGIISEKTNQGAWSQPQAIAVYQGRQYALPLRYAYVNRELLDFHSGLDAGVFVYPSFDGQSISPEGTLLYLSSRTIHSNLATLYLFGKEEAGFTLAHTEEDLLISQIKSQVSSYNSDFVDYQGFRGPIKIWEVHYPANIQANESYLQKDFPNPALNRARL